MERRVLRAVFAAMLVTAGVGVAYADDSPMAVVGPSAVTVVETTRHSGLRAYADPETGELVSPVAVNPSTETGSGGFHARRAQQPPVIVPAPTEAGGVMVDLRGQFMHETRVHAAGGSLSTECSPP